MFTLNYMSGEELEKVNEAYKSFPLLRPAYSVANILEDNNVLTVGPTVDWMMKRRGPYSGSGYRKIALPVPASDCDRWFPNTIVNAAWRFTEGYVAFADNEVYIIGDKYYNNYGFGSDPTESYEILGKVTVGGRFTPMIVPNFGFIIRALTDSDFRIMNPKRKSFEAGFDYDQLSPEEDIPVVNHNWTLYLVQKEGTPHPTDFIEGYSKVMRDMGLLPAENMPLGKLLQHWEYPMDKQSDCAIPMTNGKYRMQAGTQYKAYRGWEMEWEEGGGVVKLLHRRDGETSSLECYPGLEYPFVQSFK